MLHHVRIYGRRDARPRRLLAAAGQERRGRHAKTGQGQAGHRDGPYRPAMAGRTQHGPTAGQPRPVSPGRWAGDARDRDQTVGQRGVGRGLTQGVHSLLEHAQGGRLLTARPAVGQMREHPLALLVAELAIDQGRQALSQVAHAGLPCVALGWAWRGRR